MKQFHVYALVRRGEFRPFYIGATRTPKQRETKHRAKYGKDVLFAVIATFDCWKRARRVETETIDFYRSRVMLSNDPAYRPYYVKPSARNVEERKPQKVRQRWTLPVGWDTTELSEKFSALPLSEVRRVIG